MAVAGSSLRFERAESSRLAWAFAISILIHLLILGTWQAGRKLGWWVMPHRPAWAPRMLTELLQKPERIKPKETEKVIPLQFVEVTQEQATTEEPKQAKFYSDKNSQAANPKSDADTDAPKLLGQQVHVPKAEDVPLEKFTPLQPVPPIQVERPKEEPMPETKAKPAATPGDFAMAKPELNLRPDEGQQNETRPRTIKEALARLQQKEHRIPGQMMRQDGGVRNRAHMPSFDAKLTSYGDYDRMLVDAISTHWFTLLEQRDYASDSRGKVIIQFKLHHDGRVTDMNVVENSAGEVLGLICQKAILDPAPFDKWTSEMRRVLGEERGIQFTFYYN